MPPNIGLTPLGPRYVKVANAIREDLVRGEFQPGQRLKTNELATRYDTGLNTVREALQQLNGEGWIILAPNRGAVVRPLTTKVIVDIYEMREALEVCTARGFVDDIECSVLNGTFHRFINQRAGNAEITKIIENYGRLMSSIRRYVGYGRERADQVIKDHRQLIEAFRLRDADMAANITSEHLKTSCADILANYVTEVDQVAGSFMSDAVGA